MTVEELIKKLESLPPDYPVVADGREITEALIREEIYTTEDEWYAEGLVVKLH